MVISILLCIYILDENNENKINIDSNTNKITFSNDEIYISNYDEEGIYIDFYFFLIEKILKILKYYINMMIFIYIYF